MGDNEAKLYISLYREINVLQITLQQIELLIDCLGEVFYEPFLAKLNGLLYTTLTLDPNNPQEYHKTLKSAYMRSRSIKIDLDLKKIQFSAIEEKSKDNKKPYTRSYFQSILITISDHAKYEINDTITVYQYCERIIRFNKYVEQAEKMYSK